LVKFYTFYFCYFSHIYCLFAICAYRNQIIH
jgi:hypothetical protein